MGWDQLADNEVEEDGPCLQKSHCRWLLWDWHYTTYQVTIT